MQITYNILRKAKPFKKLKLTQFWMTDNKFPIVSVLSFLRKHGRLTSFPGLRPSLASKTKEDKMSGCLYDPIVT